MVCYFGDLKMPKRGAILEKTGKSMRSLWYIGTYFLDLEIFQLFSKSSDMFWDVFPGCIGPSQTCWGYYPWIYVCDPLGNRQKAMRSLWDY